MTEISVDICIIGAGSGGLSVAAGAAQLGMNVALIEKGEMGGDCLNTGCVPSKALLAAAKAAQNFRNSEKFGVNGQEPDIDFKAVKAHIKNVVAAIEPHDSQERFEGLGVQVFRDHGRFLDAHRLQAGEQTIRAKYFIIASGSSAAIPPIKGLEPEKILTNETIFDLQERPEHLIIIGGGPIGVEMAQAHRWLGSEVTLIDMGPILANDDPDLTAYVRKALTSEGVRLFENTRIQSVNHTGDNRVGIQLENGNTVSGSHLLIAAGRKANLNMDLDKAGIIHTKRGIEVDKRLRTNQKHIFAIGDVAFHEELGSPQFTHVAGYHAGIVIKNILFKMPAKIDYSALPWITYSDPELAHVGMNETQAREKFGDKIKITTWDLKENDRALAEDKNNGLIKVITQKNGKILGASIVGSGAGELIGPWILAISQGLKIGAFANMIAPYPTMGEISKRAAGAYYTPSLFSERTRKIVSFLQKLPF